MFCSTIIATIGHPRLGAAVRSVLEQDFTEDDFEVIVVNDTGHPIPKADWQDLPRVRTVITQRRERSVARNTGAAIAKGTYLHFLDQDDIMLPGALQAFWHLSHHSENATWLYGSYESMDNVGVILEEFHPAVQGDFFAACVAGELIPLHASLVQASAFFAAGGFDPTYTIAEDIDLERRIALQGNVAKTPATVARIRVGRLGSTGDWGAFPEREQCSREKILNYPHALSHLLESTASNSYLRGRLCRVYAASAVRNLNQKNILLAASRGISLIRLMGFHCLSRKFWRGLRRMANSRED